MMVGLRLVVSIVNCTILTIAGILTVVSLWAFDDAYNDYKNQANSHCFLFVSLDDWQEGRHYGSNGVCNFVVAADVIVLLLILASGVAMVMTFFTVKYVLCTCYTLRSIIIMYLPFFSLGFSKYNFSSVEYNFTILYSFTGGSRLSSWLP